MREVTRINQSKIDSETVEVLREMLARAESGELESIIYIDKNKGGKVGYGWDGAPDAKMIGKMEELKFTLMCQKNGIDID